ncbi:MAG: HXXEE domain-containing protein [Anaerolineaceae bacterium]
MIKSAFPWLYLGLGFSQAAHSIEEVLTGLWNWKPAPSEELLSRLAELPPFIWSEEGFAAANLVVVALLLGFSPLVFMRLPWAWKVARVVAIIETLNGMLHLTVALVSGGYFPGCISGVVLIALSIPIWAIPRIRRLPSGTD